MNPRIVVGNLKHSFSSKRKIEKDNLKFGITSTYIFMVGFTCVLLLYYVWTLNVNATKGYTIRQLEIEKRQLLIEKELLDVKIAELESLGTITKDSETEGMEPIETPDYLVIREGVQYVYKN